MNTLNENYPLCGYDCLEYVSCDGIGDIIGGLNITNNIGKFENKIISLYFSSEKALTKAYKIYNCFFYSNVEIKGLSSNIPKNYKSRKFQPWGSDCSWMKGWLYGAIKENFNFNKHMVVPKIGFWNYTHDNNNIGMSFSVNTAAIKKPQKLYIINLINELLKNNKKIIYFGFIGNSIDNFIKEKFCNEIEFYEKDIDNDFLIKMKSCSYFYGTDSGMSWISSFLRIPTEIILSKTFYLDILTNLSKNEKMKTFEDIPWVLVKFENFEDLKSNIDKKWIDRNIIYKRGEDTNIIILNNDGTITCTEKNLLEKFWTYEGNRLFLGSKKDKVFVMFEDFNDNDIYGFWTNFDHRSAQLKVI